MIVVSFLLVYSRTVLNKEPDYKTTTLFFFMHTYEIRTLYWPKHEFRRRREESDASQHLSHEI